MELKEQFNKELQKFILENQNIFSFKGENKVSSILLFKDYLYRLNSWKRALQIPFQYLKEKDTHNIFVDMNPLWINKLPTYEDFAELITKITQKEINNRYYNYLFIYLFIIWNIIEDKAEIKNFPNIVPPYDSVIKIVKNNNGIYKQDGIYVCDLLMKIRVDFKLPSIQNDFLDYIDSKYKLIGSLGIPNQEKVNELWEEFQSLKK